MRYAIYFTPAPDSELYRRGSAVLGYDCYAQRHLPAPHIPGIAPEELAGGAAGARKYGFHATIKPPFSLRKGAELPELRKALAAFAATTAPVYVGQLEIAGPGAFVALEPVAALMDRAQIFALQMLAAETVAWFDAFRAPLSDADLLRRPPSLLPPRQQALQQRWGYPWVFEAFRFHMTLSDKLADLRLSAWRESLAQWFGPVDLTIDALTLMEQENRDSPFRVVERFELSKDQVTDSQE